MKRDPRLDAWIPLEDYIVNGERKPRSRPVQMGKHPVSLPETWVGYEDHVLRGVRKLIETPEDEAFIDRLKPLPPSPEVPEEAYMNIFDALQEVWALPGSNSAVFRRLNMMAVEDRIEWSSGRIGDAEYQRRQKVIEEIRLQYAARAEDATNWFLEHRFRLFETLPNA
ncbi:MAG: hypothetical protein HQL95_16195 [Magnetococcales bacterium]|nr:hypothetical protein [Magnetococcales bacterium]